ncbi:hypothetical protein [Prescottella agglutinans]|uniref:hypothetical protein n=1 Tax=Prescottella agglutinans TaxID=1644129 RepID=UPI003D98ABFF
MRITQRPSPPTGWKRRFLRAPVTLYRWHPRAQVQVGRRRSDVEADFLGTEEGGDLMAHYGRVHPKNIHFVRLRPVHG